MNRPGSVAYGWGVLLVAGLGSYIWAKGHVEERRKAEKNGTRPREVRTWQERVSDAEKAAESAVNGTPKQKAQAQQEILGTGAR
ncbi:hypothetical protein NliqN6_0835 [Naganishia liquefaciens]|uniref:Uncharacterized protein n=1 Tax=Naganishia liquefaciens TaxID=104408 RepID=A0A8H3TNT3_9TREE|nr:hypothetical protein NliqN6_0835 [Naganishia liquefaciens]